MIRDQLGRTRAETLILGSHYGLNGGVQTFEAAANAILDEHASLEKDSPRFKKEQDAIRRIFSERLILP
ncbi:MAG: hypothetical protein IPK58_24390 [Acidobacteria bacterium]|nr:hypothetical protein [Acidobacteriota bacterium]